MRQIIYMSSLVSQDLEQLRSVICTSFEHNRRNGISGMILYCDGNIVQALEGKKEPLTDTFSRILVDMRHVGIHVLLEDKVDHREFKTWSFGFKNIKKSDVEKWNLEGDWFKASEKDISARVSKGRALTVLRSFFAD